ncbi:hypothetical protein LPJ59_007123, partial [Coemansia sp. RSA 2399]
MLRLLGARRLLGRAALTPALTRRPTTTAAAAAAAQSINIRTYHSKQVPDSVWDELPLDAEEAMSLSPANAMPLDRLTNIPQETEAEDIEYVEDAEDAEDYHESTLRGTDEMRFGCKYMGMVELPQY